MDAVVQGNYKLPIEHLYDMDSNIQSEFESTLGDMPKTKAIFGII